MSCKGCGEALYMCDCHEAMAEKQKPSTPTCPDCQRLMDALSVLLEIVETDNRPCGEDGTTDPECIYCGPILQARQALRGVKVLTRCPHCKGDISDTVSEHEAEIARAASKDNPDCRRLMEALEKVLASFERILNEFAFAKGGPTREIINDARQTLRDVRGPLDVKA